MRVWINGAVQDLPDGATLVDALARLGVERARSGVAIAVDDEVVPRRAWDDLRLGDGARVEVVTAAQGG